MLNQIKSFLKIEIIVLVLALLILLNYFVMFIGYKEPIIKFIFSSLDWKNSSDPEKTTP